MRSAHCAGRKWTWRAALSPCRVSELKTGARTKFLCRLPSCLSYPYNPRAVRTSSAAAPLGAWSRDKRRLDARLGDTVRPWRLHDLRRTAATGMADIGIGPHIIEQILNHQSGHKSGVAGIYNRSSYAVEKAAALVRWDEHVASIVGGDDE